MGCWVVRQRSARPNSEGCRTEQTHPDRPAFCPLPGRTSEACHRDGPMLCAKRRPLPGFRRPRLLLSRPPTGASERQLATAETSRWAHAGGVHRCLEHRRRLKTDCAGLAACAERAERRVCGGDENVRGVNLGNLGHVAGR